MLRFCSSCRPNQVNGVATSWSLSLLFFSPASSHSSPPHSHSHPHSSPASSSSSLFSWFFFFSWTPLNGSSNNGLRESGECRNRVRTLGARFCWLWSSKRRQLGRRRRRRKAESRFTKHRELLFGNGKFYSNFLFSHFIESAFLFCVLFFSAVRLHLIVRRDKTLAPKEEAGQGRAGRIEIRIIIAI